MAELRALTVRPPWSHLIAHCGKTVENRTRPVSYRGTIAIHAGLSWDAAAEFDRTALKAWRDWSASLPPMNITGPLRREAIHVDLGAVVAVAEVTCCHYGTECSDDSLPPNYCSPWARAGQWHIELAGIRPLRKPVECRGMLGLWKLPEDVEKAVREQLETTDC